MKCEVKRRDEGPELVLRIEAENDLEAIAIMAWFEQAVKNGRDIEVMPTRHFLIATPAVTF